jgi:hypothetical protein
MNGDSNIFKSDMPNFFLLRLRGYNLNRKTDWVTLIKAIRMIHAIAMLEQALNLLIL